MATKSTRVHFNCPHCNALYRIVKVEVGPETITDEWVTCRNCAGRLPTRDGNSVIKYFLLRKPLAPYGRARRPGSQRAKVPDQGPTSA